MTNTEKFFVECIKCGIKGRKIESVPDGIDYKQFYKLCSTHSMSVIVYRALEKVKDNLPRDLISILQRSMQRHVMIDVQSEYDKNEFLSAMEARGLKHMPLKGYYLKKLYPTTDMRYASDCDVLIDVSQLKEVRALVKELGLKTKRHDEHHDIVYYPNTKTIFELHKCIFVGEFEKYFGVGFEKAHLKEGTNAFYELGVEDFYATILGHSAYHFAEGAGVGIRHVIDVYLYKNAYELDYEYLDKELERCGLLKFKNLFEAVADYFFDDKEVDEQTIKIAAHILESSLFNNEGKQVASRVAASAVKVGDKKARRRTFLRKVFLTKSQMQFLFPVLKKAIWLLPVFHVVRWGQVLFTRPKAIAKLKSYNAVDESVMEEMKEIRGILGIEHL